MNREEILTLTAQIISAHVANNTTPADVLPSLIHQVYSTLEKIGSGQEDAAKSGPKTSIGKTIFPDHLICLEDGKSMKMLKRHLMTAYNMTPEEYRAKWKLPADYPMVAPNYAKHRSGLAKKIGLGTRPNKAQKGLLAAVAAAKRSQQG